MSRTPGGAHRATGHLRRGSGLLLAVALAACGSRAPAALGGDAWPVDRHDSAQSGRSTAVGPDRPLVRSGWPVAMGAGALRIAPNGNIAAPVIGSTAEGIHAADGRLRRLTGAHGVMAIGADGRRYARAGVSADAVEARDSSGRLLWRSAPLWLGETASDRTFVPLGAGGVAVGGPYGTAALDGAGRVMWTDGFGFANPGAVAAAPDGTVYFGHTAADGFSVGARRADGGVAWTRELPGAVRSLAFGDGRVIAVHDRASVAGGAAVVALDGADGTVLWRYPTGRALASAPALGADGSVVVVVSGALVALGRDGELRFRLPGPFVGPALIGGDGTIYAGGAPAVAVGPTGRVRWRLGARRTATPQALGADGTLYLRIGSLALALSPPGTPGTRIPPPPRGPLIGGLRVRPNRLRVSGPASTCPSGPGTCRPSVPLGAIITVRMARAGVVGLQLRRAGSARVVRRLNLRAPAGTSWYSATDLMPRRLAPGRYLLSARAAVGTRRAVSGPVALTVVP